MKFLPVIRKKPEGVRSKGKCDKTTHPGVRRAGWGRLPPPLIPAKYPYRPPP